VHISNLFGRQRSPDSLGDSTTQGVSRKPIRIPYASYGGLFFHTSLLRKIGYPNEDFFLYADDREFSYRITCRGGRIFLIPKSLIYDVHMSDHHSNVTLKPYDYLLKGDPQFFKTYYLVRNNAYFQYRFWTDSPLIYSLNKFLFFLQLFWFSLRFHKLKRFWKIWQAVQEGEKGLLGFRPSKVGIDSMATTGKQQ
jgi:GT2 family glycosyltransferase